MQRVDQALVAKLHELRCLSGRLVHLNAHDALFLLKNCFAVPKLTYTLRCAPCYTRQLLSEYDDVMQAALQSVLNVSISDEAWNQATLPVAKGGIGVRGATQIALPAFLSSVVGSQSLVTELLPARLYISYLALAIRCSRLPLMIGSAERTLHTFKCRFPLRRRTGTKRWWISRRRRRYQLHLTR